MKCKSTEKKLTKHPYEVQEEIERIENSGYLHVDEWDNHASDYDRARRWGMYTRTLQAYIDRLDVSSEWLFTINNSLHKLEKQIKEYKSGKNKRHFCDEYDCERAEIDVIGCRMALDFLTSKSTIVKTLQNRNKKLKEQIKELMRKERENRDKIKEIKEWRKENVEK